MTGQRVGYVRVSSLDQNPERQLDQVKLDRIFVDKSSDKDTSHPQLAELLAFAHEEDTVVVHSMDRPARNLDDLRKLVQRLTQRGICVEFSKESLSFTAEDSPTSQLLLSVQGAVAEFEGALIRWRQKEGIALAKSRGVYKGRTKTLCSDQITKLRYRTEAGEPKAVLATEFGISRDTLYRYLKPGPLDRRV